MILVVVETSEQEKTVQAILGKNYKVVATKGQVRDLPARAIGLAAPAFRLDFVATDQGRRVLNALAKEAAAADEVYLALNPDLNGEDIAWQVTDALRLHGARRVSFDEVTETAVKKSLERPRPIDLNLVQAGQARRALDRMVGYLVSPALSRVIGGRHSVGRVQSGALRLLVEREAEIRGFIPPIRYGAELLFSTDGLEGDQWRAKWNADNWPTEGMDFPDLETASEIAELRDVDVVDQRDQKVLESPPAPFNTAGLLQAAGDELGFDFERTMGLLIHLYGAGHISYYLTGSGFMPEENRAAIRAWAAQAAWPVHEGPDRWPGRDDRLDQERAICPVRMEVEAIGGDGDGNALYRLIRDRTLASQLQDAVFDERSIILGTEFKGKTVLFESRSRRMRNPGWLGASGADAWLRSAEEFWPDLPGGGRLTALAGEVIRERTRPPERYTPGLLVRIMESLGIGRPSSFSDILDTLIGRGYAFLENGELTPTGLGENVISVMADRFSFLNYGFTREMENRLDEIAAGRRSCLSVVQEEHARLEAELEAFMETAGHRCPDCGRPLRHHLRTEAEGQKGYDFWSCSGRPACSAKFADEGGWPGRRLIDFKSFPLTEHSCEECGQPLRRVTAGDRKAYHYWSCSGYPDCRASFSDVDGRPGEKRKAVGES